MDLFVSFKFSKIFFLLLLTAILSGAAAQKTEERRECWRRSSSLFGGNSCCGNEEYSYNHLEKFTKVCNTPPKNQSLSLPESHWKFFECLLTKFLDPKPLTLENFGEVMASNLSAPVRQAILSSLKKKEGPKDVTTLEKKSETDTLHLVASYWTKYFDSEFEVCWEKKVEVTTNRNFTESDRKLHHNSWERKNFCGNATYPAIDLLSGHEKERYLRWELLNQKYAHSNLTSNDRRCLDDVSLAVYTGLATQTELEGQASIDYEGKLKTLLMPSFWSKSVTDLIVGQLPKVTARITNGTENASLPKLVQSVHTYAENRVNQLHPKEELKNMCIKGRTLHTLYYAVHSSMRSICPRPSYSLH